MNQIDTSRQDISMLDLTNVNFVSLSAKNPLRDQISDYESVFSFWHSQWANTFQEISLDFKMAENEFMRHLRADALFINNRPAAIVLVDELNPSLQVHKNHSYFHNYPPQILDKIAKLAPGDPVYTMSYLAVDQIYRKKYQLPDLLLSMTLQNLFYNQNRIVITYTRNLRKTNDLTYRLGAKSLAQSLVVRNEPSDFVYFDHECLHHLIRHQNFEQTQFLKNPKQNNRNKTSDIGNYVLQKGVPYEANI